MKKSLLYFAPLFILFFVLFACNKSDKSAGTARLQVSLTDDPADYDAVYIDVQDIQINVTGVDDHGWQSLPNVNTGIYNLLDLVNDKDTILADAGIPSGRLHQIRLVLGPDNSIVVDGESHPLQTPSAMQSGLKLNVQQDVTNGILYKLTLDFEAARSIVETGNNNYILKPVIRTVLQAVGGSILGNVQPTQFNTLVLAIQGSDTTATTYTDGDGNYLLRGLPAGTYDLFYLPSDPLYLKDSIMGVGVQTGIRTSVDTVFLHQ